MTEDFSRASDRAASLLMNADALIVTAGAGMGVDSGLPDFRGVSGFWRAYPALAEARLRFEQIASPATFRTDPQLAWGFYGHRLTLYRKTVPHAGFGMLLRWAERLPRSAFVFTSNVDGQFQKAGFLTERIHECHRSLHLLQCSVLCGEGSWPASSLEPVIDEATCRWLGPVPTCPRCGAVARPNVLMFGDNRWCSARSEAQRQRLATWLSTVKNPVVIECGAGTAIPSVRNFSEWITRTHRGRLVRVNPREPKVPSAKDVSLPAGALQGLSAINEALGRQQPSAGPAR